MGFDDRDYTKDNYRPPQRYSVYGGGRRMGFPPITPAVKWLLIINLALFVLGSIRPVGEFLWGWLSVLAAKGNLAFALSFWRYISYQFLHAGVFHILMNMLGLFFLGPVLERSWGTKRFLMFYFSCGALGGMFYQLLVQFGVLGGGSLVGASGAILGMLAACAILFPQFVVFFMFFPVPIRIACVILTVMYVANLLKQGVNAGGDAAHLAGMAAGAFYVLWGRYSGTLKKAKPSNDIKNPQKIFEEVDRILEKVSRDGIDSLSRREKNILKQATKMEQKR